MTSWYNQFDKFVCTIMLIMFLIKIYSNVNWTTKILDSESCVIIFVVSPILIIDKEEMTMVSYLYILISLSRYLRFAYFFLVLMRNHEFAENDIDRSIIQQLVIIVNMVIILAGIFGEMENFHFLEAIDDGTLVFIDGYS
jgi:hypothetical protein